MSLPHEYRSTVFRLENPPAPLPASFAIITAWNPMDEPLPREANEAADHALLTDLQNSAAAFFRATGGSPGFSHYEPGWAAHIPKADAIALGRKYRQRAIWWVESDDLLLIACDTCREESVGSFRQRLSD